MAEDSQNLLHLCCSTFGFRISDLELHSEVDQAIELEFVEHRWWKGVRSKAAKAPCEDGSMVGAGMHTVLCFAQKRAQPALAGSGALLVTSNRPMSAGSDPYWSRTCASSTTVAASTCTSTSADTFSRNNRRWRASPASMSQRECELVNNGRRGKSRPLGAKLLFALHANQV